ncbi:ATP-dependent RNA helicase MSS116 [Microdochium nivale]|nr:ATP-dependent RNA helicase MSS116 [Microdochium nivale]
MSRFLTAHILNSGRLVHPLRFALPISSLYRASLSTTAAQVRTETDHKDPSFKITYTHESQDASMADQQNSRRHPYRGGAGKNFRRGRPGRPQGQQQDEQDGDSPTFGQRGGRRGGARPAQQQHHQLQQDDSDQQIDSGTSTPLNLTAVENPALTIDIPMDTPMFAELAKDNLVHPTIIQTITDDLKFGHMTPVQAATIYELLNHTDVLAQAKTGTGKTLAFLLPAIQTMLKRKLTPGKQISLLVISPTRELAMQIAKEAEALLQRMPQYKVCLSIGGTNKDSEERRILRSCDILIGTPGRLYDHMGTNSGGVADKLQSLDTLVLDEADRLLDMGFLDSLKKIISCLPNKETSQRQGMLFSATIADHVQKVAHLALSKNYKFISTIPKGEINTHERVPQHLIVVPTFADMAAGLVGAIRAEIAANGSETFKAIIFAPTAGIVDFYHDVLSQLRYPGMPPVCALHARLTQSKRTKTTDEFRNAQNGILVATDVIARGMDFPGITNVFQAGIPSDKESYIHRLGRTARAGAEGRGHFIITQQEAFFPKYTLKEISFHDVPADLSAHGDVLNVAERLDTHGKTYQGWLGFYKSYMKPLGWDAATLVREANKYALEGLGAPEVPTLQKSTVGKMGLKGTKGLVVGPDAPKAHRVRLDRVAAVVVVVVVEDLEAAAAVVAENSLMRNEVMKRSQ